MFFHRVKQIILDIRKHMLDCGRPLMSNVHDKQLAIIIGCIKNSERVFGQRIDVQMESRRIVCTQGKKMAKTWFQKLKMA